MISDPILLNSEDISWHTAKGVGERFVMTVYPGTKRNLALYYFSEFGKDLFAIITGHAYWIGTTSVTKEELIDHISEEYPDHMEWLLWHPEWLE